MGDVCLFFYLGNVSTLDETESRYVRSKIHSCNIAGVSPLICNRVKEIRGE